MSNTTQPSAKIKRARLIEQPTLVTKRLTLRPLVISDAPRIKQLVGNPNVSRTTRSIPYPYDEGMAESWITLCEAGILSGESIAYAIQQTKQNELIGTIGLNGLDKPKTELGYWIGEQFWGVGYCTEATKALLKFAFNCLEIKEIFAEHLTSNSASGRVMNNAGMSHIATTRKECRQGKIDSVEIYQILKI